jgi:TonB family protein
MFLPGVAYPQRGQVEDLLRSQYRDKTLVLRGFYSGSHLHYDSSGAPDANQISGDWTSDGLVQVENIRFAHHHLIIEARRLLVIEFGEKEFRLAAEAKHEKRKLEIEVDLDGDRVAPQQADAAMSGIFLTAHDDLSALVPDYWKPCVLAAAAGSDKSFRFSPELLAIPGIASAPASVPAEVAIQEKNSPHCNRHTGNKRGVFPRAIYSPQPEFSSEARRAGFQGTVTLKLVVNEKGDPEYVRITGPLGRGLDEQALDCVRRWKFQPAEKDGQPVVTEISVEVNFRLY